MRPLRLLAPMLLGSVCLTLVATSCSQRATHTEETGWSLPSRGDSPRTLYMAVAESTIDHDDPCFISYRTAAAWTGEAFEISAYGTTVDSDGGCDDVGVAAWAVVHLPRDFHGAPLRDALNGDVRKLVEMPDHTSQQIVNRRS